MSDDYFISFVGEAIFSEEYQRCVAGRIEIEKEGHPYAISEYRIFTDKTKEFHEFLEKYDFRWVDTETLKEIKEKSNYFNTFNNKL